MILLVILTSALLTTVAFLDWLYPRFNDSARDTFENWYLRLADADYKSIGPYTASLVTTRLNESLGMKSLSLRFFIITLVFSQTLFALIFLNISSIWGLTFNQAPLETSTLLELVLGRLGHALVPLIAINSLADMISLYVTRGLLRRAADSPTALTFAVLMMLDTFFAISLAAMTLFIFGHFLFAANFTDSLAAFSLNSSILYVILIVTTIGLFLIFAGVQQKRYKWVFWPVGGYILFLVGYSVSKIVEAELYSSLLIFDVDDIAVVLVLAVSTTAMIPTMLGMALLVLLFFVNLLIPRIHGAASHVALQLAETKRGILSFMSIALMIAWDLIAFLYATTWTAP